MSAENYVCGTCRSDDIKRDAWAKWDADLQVWVLDNVFDAAWCETCEAETSLEEAEIKLKGEKGAASLLITLDEGVIEARHGTDGSLLGRKKVAVEGDWDRIIKFLCLDLALLWDKK